MAAPSHTPSITQPRFKKLCDWLQWQEGLHFTSIELGLSRCKAVAKTMDILNPKYTVISVAGTNGKGSSVTMLNTILTEAGYKTGCYMSPHLTRYNERIRVGGIEVDDETICDSFARIDEARGDISLTYFEFGTLAALDIFKHSNIDVAILEVGLGGRLDAVNILDADVALVSSIALDHEFWLGKDRESIAIEKAGIFRSASPAVCSDPNPPQSLLNRANELGVHLSLLGRQFEYEINGDTWTWRYNDKAYHGLPKPSVYNNYQVQNAAGVLMVLMQLGQRFDVPEDAIHRGLQAFQLEGRFQVIAGKVPMILDVAHNQQAARILAENLQRLPVSGKTHVIIGMLSDKDHRAVFSELIPIADSWYILQLKSNRSTKSKVLVQALKKLGNTKPVNCFDDMSAALDFINGMAKQNDRIIITGSFLTVGAAIEYLNRKH